MNLSTWLIPLTTFLLGIGVGSIASLYYMKHKVNQMLQGPGQMMEEMFDNELPE